MKYAWLAAMAIVGAGLIGPRAESCGPVFGVMLFTTYRHAPLDEGPGVPGILRPQYELEDQLFAYRMLSGVHMTKEEVGAKLRYGAFSAEERIAQWVQTRAGVIRVPAPARLNPDRKVPGVEYQFFLNCLGDAFDTAAATLRQRIAKWGIDSADTAEWVGGQDQVFANCAGGAQIPPELATGNPLLMADRRYQIAAAKFYATQFDEARADFEAIGADTVSPWHEIAPYLVARCYIRQALLSNTDGADKGKLMLAAAQLKSVLNDPAQKNMHSATQSLLNFVRARVEPEERLLELEKELLQPDLGPRLQRVLTDYSLIEYPRSLMPGKTVGEDSELSLWLRAKRDGKISVEQWRARRTMPWLVAALMSVDDGNPATPELIAAARAVRPESAAYPSAAYWGIRLQIRGGQLDDARRWADEALATKQSFATGNLLRAERLKLARDWTEFLRFAAREGVAQEAEGEEPFDGSPLPAFDLDVAETLNRRVPVRLWIEASKSDLIPANLQGDLAQAAWARAIIVGDPVAARLAAERVVQLRPEITGEMRSYLAERDPAIARFAAVFLILQGPGFAPVLRSGFVRRTPVMELDDYRDNWWRPEDFGPPGRVFALRDLYPQDPIGPTEFLSKKDLAAGEAEWSRLVARAQNSVQYLSSETIAWARSHPSDRRVPQALHLVVRATRFGPSNDNSKAAFDILHRRYPNSEWTAKTKYWF